MLSLTDFALFSPGNILLGNFSDHFGSKTGENWLLKCWCCCSALSIYTSFCTNHQANTTPRPAPPAPVPPAAAAPARPISRAPSRPREPASAGDTGARRASHFPSATPWPRPGAGRAACPRPRPPACAGRLRIVPLPRTARNAGLLLQSKYFLGGGARRVIFSKQSRGVCLAAGRGRLSPASCSFGSRRWAAEMGPGLCSDLGLFLSRLPGLGMKTQRPGRGEPGNGSPASGCGEARWAAGGLRVGCGVPRGAGWVWVGWTLLPGERGCSVPEEAESPAGRAPAPTPAQSLARLPGRQRTFCTAQESGAASPPAPGCVPAGGAGGAAGSGTQREAQRSPANVTPCLPARNERGAGTALPGLPACAALPAVCCLRCPACPACPALPVLCCLQCAACTACAALPALPCLPCPACPACDACPALPCLPCLRAVPGQASRLFQGSKAAGAAEQPSPPSEHRFSRGWWERRLRPREQSTHRRPNIAPRGRGPATPQPGTAALPGSVACRDPRRRRAAPGLANGDGITAVVTWRLL